MYFVCIVYVFSFTDKRDTPPLDIYYRELTALPVDQHKLALCTQAKIRSFEQVSQIFKYDSIKK